MATRSRPGLSLGIGMLVAGVAMLGLVAEAAAQTPPPAGGEPGAAPPPPPEGGAPEAAPPPSEEGGQPSTAPTPPPEGGAPAGAPGAAPPPAAGGGQPSTAPAPSPLSVRARDTQLKAELGAEFFVPFGFGVDDIVGGGPVIKLSSHWVRWWGPFMMGGGPSLRYSYMVDTRDNPDSIHQMTINGDFMIGGGIYGKFAIYFHALLGVGAFKAYDADTNSSITFFMARAVGGIGGWFKPTRWLSVGALLDIGWPGTMQILATVGFHFRRRL